MLSCQATKTCYVRFSDTDKTRSYIFPNPKKIKIFNDGKVVRLVFNWKIPDEYISKKRINSYFCLDITDDPTTYYAGHYGSLGYYLFRFRVMNYKILNTNPFTIETRFYGGLHFHLCRPLQRPHRQIIGNDQILEPCLTPEKKGFWGIEFNNYWFIVRSLYLNNLHHVCWQHIDQYSSYNVGDIHVKSFKTEKRARKKVEEMI